MLYFLICADEFQAYRRLGGICNLWWSVYVKTRLCGYCSLFTTLCIPVTWWHYFVRSASVWILVSWLSSAIFMLSWRWLVLLSKAAILVWHVKILTSICCFQSFGFQTVMICLVVFKINVKLETCGNDGGYYDRLSFIIMLTSELLFPFFLTLSDFLCFLWYVAIYVQVYLQHLDVQLYE